MDESTRFPLQYLRWKRTADVVLFFSFTPHLFLPLILYVSSNFLYKGFVLLTDAHAHKHHNKIPPEKNTIASFSSFLPLPKWLSFFFRYQVWIFCRRLWVGCIKPPPLLEHVFDTACLDLIFSRARGPHNTLPTTTLRQKRLRTAKSRLFVLIQKQFKKFHVPLTPQRVKNGLKKSG